MAPLMAGQMPVVVVPGGEFAVVLYNRPRQVARPVLLPPPLVVIVLLRCRLCFPARGVYPATQTAHAAPALIHLFRCTALNFAATTTNLLLLIFCPPAAPSRSISSAAPWGFGPKILAVPGILSWGC